MPVLKLASGPTCVDDNGVPRLWASLWTLWIPLNASQNTTMRKLRAVESLYVVSDEVQGARSLDRNLGDAAVEGLQDALSALYYRLRNRATARGTNLSRQFRDALRFVLDILERHHGASDSDLQSHFQKLEHQFAGLFVDARKDPPLIRSLPDTVIRDLVEIFDPAGARNPFRTPAIRWRNFLLFLLLMDTGVRRGETALLTTSSIRSEFDAALGRTLFWINITETADDDPRYETPSLKTVDSQRQLPISPVLATVVNHYENEFRHEAFSEFLLTSQKANPLSVRQINLIFEVATKRLSKSAKMELARRKLTSVSCHELRHTCAVIRYKRHIDAGASSTDAKQALREYFGWKYDSEMPVYYAKACFDAAAQQAWSAIMDSTLSVLRNAGIPVLGETHGT